MTLFILIVVEEESAVDHDRVMLLGDLVSLWKVSVVVMLAVELNLRQNSTPQAKRRLDRDVQTLLVQHGQHAG